MFSFFSFLFLFFFLQGGLWRDEGKFSGRDFINTLFFFLFFPQIGRVRGGRVRGFYQSSPFFFFFFHFLGAPYHPDWCTGRCWFTAALRKTFRNIWRLLPVACLWSWSNTKNRAIEDLCYLSQAHACPTYSDDNH